MSIATLNKTQINQLSTLNNIIESADFFNKVTVDSILSEINVLENVESVLPESLQFDLHFSMIFSEGGSVVSDYYKGMTNGNNQILEAARKIFPNSHEITESIETFKNYLIELINEDFMSFAPPVPHVSSADITTALSGGELKPRKTGGGFWEVTKKLFNAITEGGSFIGIVHFILDIVGAFGDAIVPGLGVVADIINSVIYYIRGKWVLGTISLIAAVFIGGGDLLKMNKAAIESAGPVMVKLARGSVDDAAVAIQRMGAKESGPAMTILRRIVSYVGGAIAKGSNWLSSLFKNFGKITGKVPGLGFLMKPIFDFIGSAFTKFSSSLTLMCDSFKLMDAKLAKEALKHVDDVSKMTGNVAKLSDDGKILYTLGKNGKIINSFPAEKLVSSGFKELRYGADILYTTADDFAKYYKTVSKLADNPSISARFSNWAGNTIPSFTKKRLFSFKNWSFFIGKQIYKLVTGKEWTGDGGDTEWSKDEVEGHGSAAFNDWLDEQIKKKKEETGAAYVPYVELDSSDKEQHDKIIDYQNHYAKLLGEPTIMDAVSDEYDKDKTDNEFDDFFDAIAKGKVTREGSTDRVDHTIVRDFDNEMKQMVDESRTKFKTIQNFSQFKG